MISEKAKKVPPPIILKPSLSMPTAMKKPTVVIFGVTYEYVAGDKMLCG